MKSGKIIKKSGSLRRKYFSSTLILAFLVIGLVLYFFADTFRSKQKVTAERDSLIIKQALISIISKNRLRIFSNIELFLLDPTIGHYDKITQQLISDSRQLNEKFISRLASSGKEFIKHSDALKDQFSELEIITLDLFESRLDVNRQYPGFGLATRDITAPQLVVTNYFKILIDEIDKGDFVPESEELLTLLFRSEILWVRQISQYRIYLANRFATFSTDFLVVQAESLQNYRDKLLQNIDRLESLYATEDSFEGETGMQIIREGVNEWFLVFLAVREIQESDHWRTDNVIIENRIVPLLTDMAVQLTKIESILHEQEVIIEDKLQQNSSTLFVLLGTIIILFLIFIAAILISLDRIVFYPINLVSNALKSKAFYHAAPQIKKSGTLEINNLIEAFLEMDEKVNQRQDELEHQALHDYLTSLPNRFSLHQRLEYQLLVSERRKTNFSLLFIDLNNFKDVNDTLGHAAGDNLLLQVANRLSEKVRKSDTVARLGGDEFAILLPEIDREKSEQIALLLNESINQPFEIKDRNISISMSTGIVHYPADGLDAMTLLQHADIAMYSSKQQRIIFSHYENSTDIYSQHRLTLIQDLRDSIDNSHLMIFYQPQFRCDDSTVYGAEALIRWKHPELGFIQPDKIIEIAEYSGVIHQLTLWVLKHSIAECSDWHKKGYPINLSVNLSVHDFNNKSLCEEVYNILEETKLNAQFLTLEITENGMMENPSLSIDILNKFKAMGIQISVDDFGTGFSSLKYLKQFPVNELKIDKSFVLDMEKDESDKVIVQSTINLGHNLGLKVVAEGVENESLLKLIDSFDCDFAQGYHFSEPLPRSDFYLLLEKFKKN